MPADLNDYFNKKNGGGGKSNPPNIQPPQFFKDFGKKSGFLYALIIIVALLILSKPFVVINSGEVGIKATAGKYDPMPLEPGFHIFLPFAQQVLTVDTKVRVISYVQSEDLGALAERETGIKYNNAISILDARGLPVSIDLSVQYKLKPGSAPQTIATWGLAWEDKIINLVVRDVVRNVAGNYTAEDLPVKRNEIAVKVENDIRTRIDAQPGRPVKLLTVQLREIILPKKIKDQIERVQIAKQEAQRAEYEVERATQEAKKKAALAKGEADKNRIEAKGKADAITIEAKAQAQANGVISKSLTEQLLSLEQIKVQGKFNEALRENKDSKIFLTPGGSVPNIWVDTKDKQQTTSVGR